MKSDKSFALEWLDTQAPVFFGMSDRIWGFAEPALREYRSSRLLVQYLEENGFKVTTGISGMPTAFLATWGEGKPTIGFYAEYDATPGESQKPVPYRDPVIPHAAGFSDMHNGLGVASVAAAVATKTVMESQRLQGRLKIFGTPAEKLCIAKCYNARDGLYNDLDAAVCWHPWMQNTVTMDDGPGCYQAAVFDFFGIPAYGGRPWVGVSALDATTLMNVNVNFMREHLPAYESITVNEIMTAGGQCPTSLPEFAQMWYVSRAKSRKGLEVVHNMLENCAKGATSVTGANHKIRIASSIRPWLPNHIMAELAYENLSFVGPPKFSAEDKDFVREIQRNLGLDPLTEPMDETLTDPKSNPAQFVGGADDVNEFTWHAPTCWIHVFYGFRTEIKSGYGFSTPSWTRAALAKTGIAHKALLTAAKAMSCTAISLLRDRTIVEAAQKEYKDRIGVHYEPAALPKEAMPPIDLTFPPYYPEGWKVPVDIDHKDQI